jgi:hypothetical protein
LIPKESGRLFRFNPESHSDLIRLTIPIHSGRNRSEATLVIKSLQKYISRVKMIAAIFQYGHKFTKGNDYQADGLAAVGYKKKPF